MKLTFDISDKLYEIINVPSVTSEISGGVYKDRRPLNSGKEDVVIAPLYNNNEEVVLQGLINVNVFVKNISDGRPNRARLKTISEKVVSAVKAYIHEGNYWRFEIESQAVYDAENDESYCNLRIIYIVENL